MKNSPKEFPLQDSYPEFDALTKYAGPIRKNEVYLPFKIKDRLPLKSLKNQKKAEKNEGSDSNSDDSQNESIGST